MSSPHTTKRGVFFDAPSLADLDALTSFYGGHVASSPILRRALSLLAKHVGSLNGESRKASEERAAMLEFAKPRRPAASTVTPEDAGF